MKTIINADAEAATMLHSAAAAVQGATGMDGPVALVVVLFGLAASVLGVMACIGALAGDKPPR